MATRTQLNYRIAALRRCVRSKKPEEEEAAEPAKPATESTAKDGEMGFTVFEDVQGGVMPAKVAETEYKLKWKEGCYDESTGLPCDEATILNRPEYRGACKFLSFLKASEAFETIFAKQHNEIIAKYFENFPTEKVNKKVLTSIHVCLQVLVTELKNQTKRPAFATDNDIMLLAGSPSAAKPVLLDVMVHIPEFFPGPWGGQKVASAIAPDIEKTTKAAHSVIAMEPTSAAQSQKAGPESGRWSAFLADVMSKKQKFHPDDFPNENVVDGGDLFKQSGDASTKSQKKKKGQKDAATTSAKKVKKKAADNDKSCKSVKSVKPKPAEERNDAETSKKGTKTCRKPAAPADASTKTSRVGRSNKVIKKKAEGDEPVSKSADASVKKTRSVRTRR